MSVKALGVESSVESHGQALLYFKWSRIALCQNVENEVLRGCPNHFYGSYG
jgi:hypothetical protein